MTTCKNILTPTTEEPKNCHDLAITSAFNLKLCPMIMVSILTCLQANLAAVCCHIVSQRYIDLVEKSRHK